MITCPYYEFLPCSDTILCMLYSRFEIDGKHWANYPDCNKENCLFCILSYLVIWFGKINKFGGYSSVGQNA